MKATQVAAVVATGAGIGAGALAGYTTWTLNAPRRPALPYTLTPFELGVPAEEVRFRSDDGVDLAGWWMDDPAAAVSVICVHGHRGNKADMLGIGTGLLRAGHSVFMFDFRGNGDSGDGPQSLAHHEQRDLRAAIDWVAQARPGTRIAVVAYSMGAATAILTAAGDPRVEALVLDSPFATMSDVIVAAYRRQRLPSGRLVPVANLVNRVRHRYAFAEVRPIEAMPALAPRPILLVHGTADSIIPFEHAERFLAAAAPGTAQLVPFEGADHCGAYFTDRPGYISRVDAFLRESLPAQAPDQSSAVLDA